MRADGRAKLIHRGSDCLLVADVLVEPLPRRRRGVHCGVELHPQVARPRGGARRPRAKQRVRHGESRDAPVGKQGEEKSGADEPVEESPRLDPRSARVRGAGGDPRAPLGVAHTPAQRLHGGLQPEGVVPGGFVRGLERGQRRGELGPKRRRVVVVFFRFFLRRFVPLFVRQFVEVVLAGAHRARIDGARLHTTHSAPDRSVLSVLDALELELPLPPLRQFRRVLSGEGRRKRSLLRRSRVRSARLQRRLGDVPFLDEQHAVRVRRRPQRLRRGVAAEEGLRRHRRRQPLRRVELVLKRRRVSFGVDPVVDGVAQRRGARRSRGGRHPPAHRRDPPLEERVVNRQIRGLARDDGDEKGGEPARQALRRTNRGDGCEGVGRRRRGSLSLYSGLVGRPGGRGGGGGDGYRSSVRPGR